MRVRNLAKTLFYTCLLVLALQFCRQNINDYVGGRTQYSEFWEALTMVDLPILAVTLPPHEFIYPHDNQQTGYILGKNMQIHAKIFEKDETTVELMIDESVQTLFGIDIQTKFVQQTLHRKLPCFKFLPRWNQSKEVNLEKFGVHLMFTFNTTFEVEQKIMDSKKLQESLNAYITSEENSYGVAWGKWFDGGQGYKRLKYGKAVRILGAIEYHNLESNCVSESYYECLAKRLLKLNSADFEAKNLINRTLCPTLMSTNDICSTIPLPKIGSIEIPLCENETQKECFEDVLQKLRLSQEKECKRPCKILEFQIGTYRPPIHRDKTSNGFTIGFVFDRDRWLRGLRSERMMKLIKKEYLVNTFMSLVGTVGGTIGMFVGLSIVDATQWFEDFVLLPVLGWIKKINLDASYKT